MINADKELVDYMKRCFMLGFTYQRIRPIMEEKGWDQDDIDEALLAISRMEMGSHEEYKIGMQEYIFGATIFLMIIYTIIILI